MSAKLDKLMEAYMEIQEAKAKKTGEDADAPLFYAKGDRGARAGYFTNKAKTVGKINAGILGGGLATLGILGAKTKIGKAAAAAGLGGAGGALGYYGGRAQQVAMNRQTKKSFGQAGWKPASKEEYKKKGTKNRVFFPKEVIKSNFGY